MTTREKNTTAEPGVYKRGGRYWIRFSLGGLQYRESAKTTQKREAVALLAKRRQELFEGRFFPEKRKADLTMKGLQKLWLEHAAQKKSIDDDRQRFRTIVDHFKGSTPIAALRPEDIDRFRAALVAREVGEGKTMAPATVNRHLVLLHSALRLADRNGYFHRLQSRKVSVLRENNERDRICTEEEYEKLTGAASPKIRLAIILGYHTGMRLGEIAELQSKQVDLKEKMIRLESADTKTGKPRQIPLATPVVEALKAWPTPIDGVLFGGTSRDALSSGFRKLCKKTKITGLRFHDLRHTALTNLRRAGVDLFTLQAISGHKTLKVLARYQTVTEQDLRRAVERVEKQRQEG